jgi:hypothetical protein
MLYFTLLFACLAVAAAFQSPVSPVSSLGSRFFGVSTKFQSPALSELAARGSKGGTKREDLSYIETRDMTRQEMLEYNKQAEKTMNTELSVMTGFSLVISLPILYLCWVAFNSD